MDDCEIMAEQRMGVDGEMGQLLPTSDGAEYAEAILWLEAGHE